MLVQGGEKRGTGRLFAGKMGRPRLPRKRATAQSLPLQGSLLPKLKKKKPQEKERQVEPDPEGERDFAKVPKNIRRRRESVYCRRVSYKEVRG